MNDKALTLHTLERDEGEGGGLPVERMPRQTAKLVQPGAEEDWLVGQVRMGDMKSMSIACF